MILKELVVGPFASNCFIVGSEETHEGMIIDPGADPQMIMEEVDRLGLKIILIVATHAHVDHVAAVEAIKEATGAEFVMHEDEMKNKDMHKRMVKMLGMWMSDSFEPPPDPDRSLQEEDLIEIGELTFTVVHTPGHSPGGISLVGMGVVFCGDSLFNYSIGRTDFPGCSHSELMESIMTKLMVLPDETVVLCGHGPSTTIGTERNANPFVRQWADR
ncbi:MAG: MBL fold metallo-hydrolase [Desulfatiglans sp.]|nr:MBL fold metallo-hydrolase [Thermodesulfobacteriota bacterium]MEE4352336.1 MBL fold metallo-hydrolase [Desulfatiglans sp.]